MTFLDAILDNESLKIFILSMLPITELRFSIPYGILAYDLPIKNVVLFWQWHANEGSMNFLDIGAGLYFYSKDLFVGVSADNLTKDMVGFGSGSANFDPRMHFNFTGSFV